MKTISTKELSEIFNINHRDIARMVKNTQHKHLFTSSTYTSLQNKVLSAYVMGVDGLMLLLSRSAFQRGSNLVAGCDLLKEFGVKSSITMYERKFGEDQFYSMLCDFLPNTTITRQYAIAGYNVDFYLDEYNLIIEFDEPYHNIESTKISDKKREEAIKKYIMDEYDDVQHIIRVKHKLEVCGLSKIAGYIALNSNHAIGVTSLYENK